MSKNNDRIFSNDDEDDEELLILTKEANFGGDPELEIQKDEIIKHIH
jgi:hypothetical protein